LLAAAGVVGTAGEADAWALDGRKISVVTALLPPVGDRQQGTGARLRVEASGGCYRWESMRPDLVVIEVPESLDPSAESLECLERKALECLDHGAALRQQQQSFVAAGPGFPPSPEVSCQPVAILRSVAKDVKVPSEKVLVVARDIGNPSMELRTEVYLSRVARLEVETRVRRINVDEVETLAARAYDEHGNVFSSLEGLQFEWHVRDPSILRISELSQTVFRLSPARRVLTQAGLHSDLLMLHGVETGITSVSVQLSAHAGQTIKSPEVELKVAENIILVPAMVRVPPIAHLQLRLKAPRGTSVPLNEVADIPLPSKNFYFAFGEVWVLEGDNATGRVVARMEGKGRVVVSDQRIENSVSAEIIVAEPTRIRATLLPVPQGEAHSDLEWEDAHRHVSEQGAAAKAPAEEVSVWQLVLGRSYIVRLELFDKSSEALFIPPNLRATVSMSSPKGSGKVAALHIDRQTPNSAVLLVTAQHLGEGEVTFAEVSVVADADDVANGLKTAQWPRLTFKQQFRVADPLHIVAPFQGPLVLPPWHSWALQMGGGSGKYRFKLVHKFGPAICSISEAGAITAKGQVGDVDLVVEDAEAPANTVTLHVFVRHAGELIITPPQMQIPLHPEVHGEGGTASVPGVRIPVLARPLAMEGDDAFVSGWERLRFWNCSGLGASTSKMHGKLAATSSNEAVAEVSTAVLSSEEAFAVPGMCSAVHVLPKSVGEFSLRLTAQIHSLSGAGSRLEFELPLQVFAPLLLQRELLLPGKKPTFAESGEMIVVAPCSSVRLRLLQGPAHMRAPGQVFRNLSAALEGTHLRLQQVGEDTFEVLCLQPTPKPTRIIAEVHHSAEHPEVHGGDVVATASTSLLCAAPVSLEIAQAGAATPPGIGGAASLPASFGIRRASANTFHARFFSEGGLLIANASAFATRWSLQEDDAATRDAWRLTDAEGAAVVTISPKMALGATASLKVEGSLPIAAACSASHGLDKAQDRHVSGGLAALSPPSYDVIHLRAASELAVRWPGFPARFLAFAPDFAFTFEALDGTGAATLALEGRPSPEAVDRATLCNGSGGSSGCLRAVDATPATPGAIQWFVRPTAPGPTTIVVQDKELVGSSPQQLEISFLPAGHLSLRLSGITSAAAAPLIVRDESHPLAIEVLDTEGHLLPAAVWRSLHLRVESNDSAIQVREGSEPGSFAVVGTSPGVYELHAFVRNHPSAVLNSNTLRVHVFDSFDISPKHLVLLPGQTFEFSVIGGPASGAQVHFASSASDVAQVSPDGGLLSAVRPGVASITVRLLEAGTGRELAQVSANVVVALPESLTLETSAPEALMVRGGSSLRLTAELAGGGYVLTPFALTAPMGVGRADTPPRGNCIFSWSLSGSAATDAKAVPLAGAAAAVAVDVAAMTDGSGEDKELVVAVEAACPGVPKLRAQRRLQVVAPLVLLSPRVSAACGEEALAADSVLHVPLGGRVPLTFGKATEHLQMEVRDRDDQRVVEVVEGSSKASVDLVVGERDGDVLVVVHDRSGGNSTSGWKRPPLLISVSARRPTAVHAPTLPSVLPVRATSEVPVLLVDSHGTSMALPPNFAASATVSHPSVLSSRLVRGAGGETTLHLTANREGCAAINISVHVPGVGSLSDMAAVCVTQGLLVSEARPLLLLPGAKVHLSSELVALSAQERRTLAFTLRISCEGLGALPAGGAVGDGLAADIAELLGLPRGAVTTLGVRAPLGSPGCTADGLEVDLSLDATSLEPGSSFRDVAERLWFPTGEVGLTLRHLDRSFGVRAAAGAGGGSSVPAFGGVRGPVAWQLPPLRPGSGLMGFRRCRSSLVAEAEVLVARATDVQAEAPRGSALLRSAAAGEGEVPLVSNLPGSALVVPLRAFAILHGHLDGLSGELLSGPFHSQGLRFSCQPSDPTVGEFLSFEPWTTDSSDDNLTASLPLRGGPSAAQAACVVRARPTQARHLLTDMPGQLFELKVTLEGSETVLPVSTSLALRLVPQFILLPQASDVQIRSGNIAATLMLGAPSAVLRVWTGGQPVEASLHGLSEELALVVDSKAGAAVMTLTVSWRSPRSFRGEERLPLQLESRASGQVEVFLVRIIGSAPDAAATAAAAGCCPCDVGAAAAGGWLPGSRKLWVALLALVSVAFFAVFWKRSDARGMLMGAHLYPRAGEADPAAAFGRPGPNPAQALFGASPFRRVGAF